MKVILQEWGLILLVALISATLLFAPTIRELGAPETTLIGQVYETFFHTSEPEMLLGDGVDPIGSIWIVGFVEEVLFQGRSTIVPELYSPYGLDLGVHEGFAWLDTVFAMPLRWLIGTPGFYHLHVLLTMVFSFIACYWLFKCISNRIGISLILAHLMVVNEFVYQEISYGRPTQVNWIFGALFVLCSLKLLQKPTKWHWSLIAGLCFGFYCLTYWFGAAGLGFVMLFWLVGAHLFERRYALMLKNALLMIVGICLVVLPVCWRAIVPIIQGKGSKSYSNFLNDPSSTIELLGLELPIYSTEMILSWSDALIFINGRHYPIALLLGFLVVLVLSIRQMKWSFVGLSIIAILLPVGSSLTINQVAIPSSYAVLEWVFPPLVRCNFPDRLMLAPLLTIAVMFLLLSRTYIQSKSNNRVWVSIVVAVLLCGNLVRVWSSHEPSVQAFQINRALVSLARTEPGGFVEFPFDIGNNTYVQSEFHRQPILAGPGMMMVQPPASKRYRQNNSVLRDLDEINTRGFNPADKPTDVALLELYKDGFRHLVLYTEEIKQPVQMFERYLRTKGTAYPKHQIHVIPLPVDL